MKELTPVGEQIISQRFDVVVVLGSPLMQNEQDDEYYPDFEEYNPSEEPFVDGDLKARAIQVIYEAGMSGLILVTGGKEKTGTSRATKLAEHSISRYGIPKRALIPLTTAPHTLGNMETTGNFFSDNPDIIPSGRIGILTNSFHIARSEIFRKANRTLSSFKTRFLSAEALLLHTGNADIEEIRKYYKSSNTQSRIASERQGRIDLLNGTYTPRS